MITIQRAFFLALAVSCVAGCGGDETAGDTDSPPDITGHWVSAAVETRSGAGGSKLYLRRDFDTKTATSAARFDFYEDAEGKTPSVSVWLNGPYKLTEAWAKVPGSWAGEFVFQELKITPKNQAMTELLNGSAAGTCGSKPWEMGVEQDASDTGCLTLGIDIKNKSTEYDIVKRDGDELSYGARPADGSGLDSPEKRPTALQVPLEKAP
jgi:hypothetical protein